MRASSASDVFVRAIAAVRVNHITIEAREVRKERRLGAGVVIAGGNVYFRLAGALFRMFPTMAAWVAHEQRMFHVLHQREVRRDRRAIVMPRLPGRDLRAILEADPEATSPIVMAGRALAELHARGLSHGDVNLGNVIVDEHASMIDFDAAHDDRLAIAYRAADDLVGFALDLLHVGGDFERRWAAFVDGYGRPAAVASAFGELARPRGFLGNSLLRARAHGATDRAVRAHIRLAEVILQGG